MITGSNPLSTDIMGQLWVVLDKRLKHRNKSLVGNRIYDAAAPPKVKTPYIVYGLRGAPQVRSYVHAGPPSRIIDIQILSVSIAVWVQTQRGVSKATRVLGGIWNSFRPAVADSGAMRFVFSRLDCQMVYSPGFVGYNTIYRVFAKERTR